MKYHKIKRDDIPTLPAATKVQKRPALWKIEGHDEAFICIGPHCVWENWSRRYKEMFPKGLPKSDNVVIARNGNLLREFVPA